MKKVDFFIVGAPKSGTTSLYHYLNEHPKIQMSAQKEPNFFSHTSLERDKLYYSNNRIDTIEKYHSLFEIEDSNLRGDASVSYLFYKDVPKKILNYNYNAKIIIMLRDPIERAFSHYLMDYRLGLISESFEAIVRKKLKHRDSHLFYQQYVEVSEYAKQVKRYLEIFGKENIYFIDYDDFKNNTAEIVKGVFMFLEVDNNFQPLFKKKYNTYSAPRNAIIRFVYSLVIIRKVLVSVLPKKINSIIKRLLFIRDKKPQLSQKTRDFLQKHFESDLRELSYLLSKDFIKWIR